MSLPRRLLAVLGLALIPLLSWASPASAHASLESTTPRIDSVVATAPTSVVLDFNEDVGTALGGISVVSPAGRRVDDGVVTKRGRQVSTGLRPGLANGTYVVSWRVTSADSHPISGGFAFSIGERSETAPLADVSKTPASTRGLMTAGRLLSFTGLVLFAGALLVVAFVWPAGAGSTRVRRLVTVGWAATVAGSVLTLLLQGPNAAGLGPGSTTELRLLRAVVDTRYGLAHVARLVTLLFLLSPGPALAIAVRARAALLSALALLSGLVAVFLSFALSGHAAAAEPLVLWLSIDVVHLASVSTWVGGLVVVLLALRSAGDPEALRRWSRTAFWSVVVLTGTGTLVSLRQTSSWGSLFHTRFGVLLAVKIGLVALMVGLGAVGRELVRRNRPALLGRSVGAEAVLAAAVLSVTSVLVASVPAAEAYRPTSVQRLVTGSLTVELDVQPALRGTVQLHAYVTDGNGKAVDVPEITARIAMPTRAFGPVDVTLNHRGPGHWENLATSLPYSGRWSVSLRVRSSDIDSYPADFTVVIR